jgi:hypothetical protein
MQRRIHKGWSGALLLLVTFWILDSAQGQIHPQLIQPLRFTDGTVSTFLSPLEASNLMTRKIWVGDRDPDGYNFLGTNFDGARIHVETIKEYKAAIKSGYTAYTTYDLAMESWFIGADATVGFMAQAKPSQSSYLKGKFLEQLPVTLLDPLGSAHEYQYLKQDAARGNSLLDYMEPKSHRPLHDVKLDGHKLTFSDDNYDYSVAELARGDIDGDGIEDVLIMVSAYVRGGSGRIYFTIVASKTSRHQRQLRLSKLDFEK